MLPVLVTFFNRPSTLERVLEAIFEISDLEVFFAADGPRNLEDKLNLERCWELVDKYFPNTPPVRKFARNTNCGCRVAMTQNITWFFDLVPHGVILEDDCLPNANFFKVQQILLQDITVARNFISISGSRVVIPGQQISAFQVTPSVFPMVWGWGTWANTWKKYIPEILDASEITAQTSRKLFPNKSQWLERKLFQDTFNARFREVNVGYIDTWDYALTATAWRENLSSLHMSANSIINIGFGSLGTHTVLKAPNWVPTRFEEFETNGGIIGDWNLNRDTLIAKLVFNCTLTDFSKNQIKRVLIR